MLGFENLQIEEDKQNNAKFETFFLQQCVCVFWKPLLGALYTMNE